MPPTLNNNGYSGSPPHTPVNRNRFRSEDSHFLADESKHQEIETGNNLGTPTNEKTPLIDSLNSHDNAHQARFDISDKLYKRRGGMGWNAEHNWVLRFFTLYGPVLCYYDSPEMKDADPSRPRNRIDLSKEDILVGKQMKNKPSAPSDYFITINIYAPLGGKKKWELCCPTKEQQEAWYEALHRFDGKPIHFHQRNVSLSFYDQVAADDGNNQHIMNQDQNSRKHKSPRGSFTKEASVQALENGISVLSIPFATLSGLRDRNIMGSFVLINISAVFIRYGSVSTALIFFIILNFTISYLCARMVTTSFERRDMAIVEANGSMDEDELIVDDGSHDSAEPILMDPGSSIKQATIVNKELKEEVEKNGAMTPTAIQLISDSKKEDYEPTSHSYWSIDPKMFNLRVGPNYKRNKLKAPSADALYNLSAFDIIKTPSNVDNVTKFFTPPHIPGVTDVKTAHPKVPPMLVVLVNIPSEEPSMFNSPTTGPSFVTILYLTISDKTRKELEDLENASPAVKLLAKWCDEAEHDETCRGRFKVMAYLDDIEELGLPGFIAGYNGKPALITKSGTFTRCENYIHFSVNVHMFAFIARKCLFSLQPKFPSFILNIGMTIEGRSEEEMPECLLGGVRAINLDLDKVKRVGN